MFCKHCGESILKEASICVKCGCKTGNDSSECDSKNRAVYVILALIFGLLGIHNFYAGHTTKGVIQLAITLFVGWLLVPLLIVWVWNIIEIFVVTKDGKGNKFG